MDIFLFFNCLAYIQLHCWRQFLPLLNRPQAAIQCRITDLNAITDLARSPAPLTDYYLQQDSATNTADSGEELAVTCSTSWRSYIRKQEETQLAPGKTYSISVNYQDDWKHSLCCSQKKTPPACTGGVCHAYPT